MLSPTAEVPGLTEVAGHLDALEDPGHSFPHPSWSTGDPVFIRGRAELSHHRRC